MAVSEIDVDALEELGPDNVQLIDVREPAEYQQARVPGARLVPLATEPDILPELDGTRAVYLICASGGRSLNAATWLSGHGFDAVNVAGGTKAWIAAGKACESDAAST